MWMDRWRFLIDEDTAADTATELERRGYDAVTVPESVGDGALDQDVAEHAIEPDWFKRGFRRSSLIHRALAGPAPTSVLFDQSSDRGCLFTISTFTLSKDASYVTYSRMTDPSVSSR